ncbi:activating transcription factor 7-interacting protein 2 isoform X2 [Dasypus novemcinctus]|uniref:activating transcription factor 7-interacting protein 2 isoform X2 n=1 Tax=Dasypus novemcinctus TaxID=9361 RepID=UPI0026602521|nr:activating transcription factor 7-interacting protein 2 isoform X2 [Dasypus novemcinctus]XP_058142463.1 activating transcription factor 7-interacting protein 2 isoform X2 [Dasypus novemcinctus]
MASPERSNRKILRAKKTMPTSCRKQVEILTKSKNIEALKATTIGNNVPRYNQNLSAGIIQSKCTRSEKDVSSLDSSKNVLCSPKSEVFAQNLVEPVKEIIGSKIRLECINEQVVDPYQKPDNIIASPRKLFPQEAKDSQNTCENHSEYQANVTRSFFEQHEGDCHLNSIYSPSRVLSSIVQMPKYTVTSTLDDQRSVKMVSYLETDSNSESHDKRQNDILCSDTCFMPVEKAPNVVNSISSSCHAANILKTEDSSRTCYSSISTCGSRDSMWHSSFDNTDNSYSHNQKKRMFSENKENVKRTKTSEQINENICLALEKQRTLLEQARIAKLQRRIKTVLSQRNSLEPNMLSSNTDCEVTSSETMYMDKIQESVNSPNEKMTSMNYEPSKPPEKASAKTNLSLGHIETVSESNNDDVMLISVASPNLKTSIASNPTDIGKIKSRNSSDLPDAEPEIMSIEKKKLDPVIDLTKEGLSNCNTESPVSTLESPVKFVLNSKETTPVAQNAAQILESFEHLPPLPEPPPPLPELVDKIRDTLPPQKPELKVKRVLRPRGIALTWNITKINPKCAPVESYHLFLCHESPSNKLIWKKIGEIKALPLPMACTVSQFLSSNKYYFTVQSKDIFGRYGPFCDIKSIPGFSENLT